MDISKNEHGETASPSDTFKPSSSGAVHIHDHNRLAQGSWCCNVHQMLLQPQSDHALNLHHKMMHLQFMSPLLAKHWQHYTMSVGESVIAKCVFAPQSSETTLSSIRRRLTLRYSGFECRGIAMSLKILYGGSFRSCGVCFII